MRQATFGVDFPEQERRLAAFLEISNNRGQTGYDSITDTNSCQLWWNAPEVVDREQVRSIRQAAGGRRERTPGGESDSSRSEVRRSNVPEHEIAGEAARGAAVSIDGRTGVTAFPQVIQKCGDVRCQHEALLTMRGRRVRGGSGRHDEEAQGLPQLAPTCEVPRGTRRSVRAAVAEVRAHRRRRGFRAALREVAGCESAGTAARATSQPGSFPNRSATRNETLPSALQSGCRTSSPPGARTAVYRVSGLRFAMPRAPHRTPSGRKVEKTSGCARSLVPSSTSRDRSGHGREIGWTRGRTVRVPGTPEGRPVVRLARVTP